MDFQHDRQKRGISLTGRNSETVIAFRANEKNRVRFCSRKEAGGRHVYLKQGQRQIKTGARTAVFQKTAFRN